jgi:regulatory protein
VMPMDRSASDQRRRRGEPKNPKSCHERALGLLAVRPRTRRELQRRLLAAGFEPAEVEDVLTRLEGVALIDDRAFAEQFATHQFDVRLAGSRGVLRGLMAKGVDADLAAQAAEAAALDEQARADQLAASKAARMTGIEPTKAFGRLTGVLLRRGYQPEVARSAARRALHIDAPEG